jgi:hypothetical protein
MTILVAIVGVAWAAIAALAWAMLARGAPCDEALRAVEYRQPRSIQSPGSSVARVLLLGVSGR